MSINKRIVKSGKSVYDLRYRGREGHQFKKTFPTKREAQQYEATLRIEKSNGKWIDPRVAEITLTQYSIHWLDTKLDLRVRTCEPYRSILRNHIAPHIGQTELSDISTPLVRTWLFELTNKGLAQATVSKAYRLLRTILNTAIEDQLIKTNPCSIIGAG